jgi:phosphatidylserine/phosphatidylglycerophosphate/cardiolipin synthase-like enzyme
MATTSSVSGTNDDARFLLTVHRGDGMALLAMNWRRGRPPKDFVGFGIQYVPPGAQRPKNVLNRLSFDGAPDFGERRPSLEAPFQKFRWVHFPFEAGRPGTFRYIVTPVFMDDDDVLHHGETQEVELELARETVPGALNVTFTRGFVASQAFVDLFARDRDTSTLLPTRADEGIDFVPTHRDADDALSWMGFEARDAILELLDQAVADPDVLVRVVAYELSQAEVVERLQALGTRLRIIIDDSGTHRASHSAESEAARRLRVTAGNANVRRQHLGQLQHNKTIVVHGPSLQRVACGSTNFSWRGFYVQNNNAVLLTGASAVQPFADAFERYWNAADESFARTPSAGWTELGLDGIDAQVTFSPHSSGNAVLSDVAADIRTARSSLLYSLAFLHQTRGAVRDAVTAATEDPDVFVAGISDRRVDGIDVQTPDGNVAPVFPAALSGDVPPPFSTEPTGGPGVRMHHKFVVIDFDRPSARVYLGSYNFSRTADDSNGENLLLVSDPRVATSYAIEAVRMFDHYQFRGIQQDPATAVDRLVLRRPPRAPGEQVWWIKDYAIGHRILDRRLFG